MPLMNRIKARSFLDFSKAEHFNFLLGIRRLRSSTLLHELSPTKKKRIISSKKKSLMTKRKRIVKKKLSSAEASMKAMKALAKLPPSMREAMLKKLQGT